jgi:molecular chaperone DnaK (HSP70)
LIRVPNGCGLAYETPYGWIETEIVEVALLKYLFQKLERELGVTNLDVVITHPGLLFFFSCLASYGNAQRSITSWIGLVAGARSVTLFSESAAAVLYNFLVSPDTSSIDTKQCFSVGFDMGGGTTDISIVRRDEWTFSEVATFGSADDGGEFLDYFLTELRKTTLYSCCGAHTHCCISVAHFRTQSKALC